MPTYWIVNKSSIYLFIYCILLFTISISNNNFLQKCSLIVDEMMSIDSYLHANGILWLVFCNSLYLHVLAKFLQYLVFFFCLCPSWFSNIKSVLSLPLSTYGQCMYSTIIVFCILSFHNICPIILSLLEWSLNGKNKLRRNSIYPQTVRVKKWKWKYYNAILERLKIIVGGLLYVRVWKTKIETFLSVMKNANHHNRPFRQVPPVIRKHMTTTNNNIACMT